MEPSKEAISVRIARLNHHFLNRTTANSSLTSKHWISREGLLDALIVLYDECNNDSLKRDKHIASFVDKFRGIVTELRRLRVNITDFEVKKVIGRGHFGEVHVVREKQTGDVYAMKKLRKSDTLSQQSVAFYEEERDIMAFSSSPWLTTLQYAFQDLNHLYLVMEFHPGGDLLALLDRFDGRLSEDMAKFYLAELTLSIHSLHSMKYVHRDIKPDNILIDRCGHLKLADFGSAAKLNIAGIVMSDMPVGTPEYIAPEVLESMESVGKGRHRKGAYGVECDYWSLGVVAYEMVFGHTPFSGDRLMSTYCNIMNHKESLVFPEDHSVSPEFCSLIIGLLKAADQRFGHGQLLQHKFFSSVDWNGLRETFPPFMPVVNGIDDTSNFVEFDHEVPMPSIDNFKVKREFSGQNLPFIGFTYAPDVSFQSDCCISPKKHDEDLKVALASKQKLIQELQVKLCKTDGRGGDRNKEMETLEKKVEDKEKKLQKLEHEKNSLECDLTKYIQEVASLKRFIDSEKKERITMERKTIELVKDTKQKWKKSEEQKFAQLIIKMKEKELALTDANNKLNEQSLELKRKEDELNLIRIKSQNLQKIIEENKNKVAKVQKNKLSSIAGMENQLEQLDVKWRKQIEDLKLQLKEEKSHGLELGKALLDMEETTKRERIAWSEESERHKMEIENLSDKLRNVNSDLEKTKQKSETLNLKSKHSQLRENAFFDKQRLMLEDALAKEKKECSELRDKLLRVEGEFSRSLMSLESHHESVLSEKVATISQMEVELKEAETEKIHLKHKIQEAENREKDNKNRVETLEAMFKRLEENIAKLTDENEKLGNFDGNNRKMTEDEMVKEKTLQQENQLLNEQLKRLEEQLLRLKEEVLEVKQGKKAAQLDLWKKEKELSETKIDLRIAKREVKAAEEKIKLLQEDKKMAVDMLTVEKNEQIENVRLKTEQIFTLEKEVGNLRDGIKTIEREFTSFQEKGTIEKQSLMEEVQTLTISVSQATSVAQNLEASQKMCKTLELKVKTMEEEERERREKTLKLELLVKSLEADLEGANRKIEALELNGNHLRQACVEMEEQLEDYQKLVSALENKELLLGEERNGLVAQLENERADCSKWKKLFEQEEIKKSDVELQLNKLSYDAQERDLEDKEEINTLKLHFSQYKSLTEELTDHIKDLEEQLNTANTKLKSGKKKEEVLISENISLKEEMANVLTQIHSLRESNLKLTSDLEEALSNCNSLRDRINECEDYSKELQVHHRHREVKMDATIKQQTKLIDYLQSINEGKKKKTLSDRLFGSHNATNSIPGEFKNKELEAQLSMEKAKNKRLMDDFMRAKTELLAIQENIHCRNGTLSPNACRKALPVPVTPKSKQVISQLVQSPDAQTPSRKPSLQRMHHKIPHRFEMKMNMRPVKCAACLDSVHFGRYAAICQECSMVAHPKCSSLLPTTCGLPFQFVRHFSETWKNGKDNLENPQKDLTGCCHKMEGWVKLLKRGKTCWERKYLRLEDNGRVLNVYNHLPMENLSPVQSFELFSPEGGVATVLGAVPLSEVFNTAKSDLPFILKVEIGCGTTCWPGGRSLLIMALSFPEKQAWVSSLESAVSALKAANPRGNENLSQPRYQGDVVSHLQGENFLRLNCCHQLSDHLLILGAEEGLYSLRISNEKNHRNHPVRIKGINCVYQIMLLPVLGIAVMIADETRQLMQLNIRELKVATEAAECSNPMICPKPIEMGIESCHLFAAQATNPADYSAPAVICAASSDKISIMKWYADQSRFMLCKQLETSEPCSCLHFAPHSVIVGCDKFFEVDLKDYSVEEFLDASDTSLAYAVLGTQQLNSFPVAVLDISICASNPEYLLCFHEFAVFVDAYGRRTREADVKWSHISFAFAFQKPYLFIFHFALVEVLRITPESFTTSKDGSKSVLYPEQALLELPNPQLLGTSTSPGSIFLCCSSDIRVGELLRIQGSLACPNSEDEDGSICETLDLESNVGDGDSSDPSRFSFTSSLEQTLDETDCDDLHRGAGNFANGCDTRKVQFEGDKHH